MPSAHPGWGARRTPALKAKSPRFLVNRSREAGKWIMGLPFCADSARYAGLGKKPAGFYHRLFMGRTGWFLCSLGRSVPGSAGVCSGGTALRAGLETTRGAVFGEKAGWQARRRRRCARPPRSNSESIREQGEARRPFPRKRSGRRVFCPWPALTRSLQPSAGRCAPPRPPWPQPKSLAAAPLVVSKQALSR